MHMNTPSEELLRAIRQTSWIQTAGAEVLFPMRQTEYSEDSGHFVVTYNFRPAPPNTQRPHGIRELDSPLSDF